MSQRYYRPVLLREVELPVGLLTGTLRKLGVFGSTLLFLFVMTSAVITTAFVMHPPQPRQITAGFIHVSFVVATPPGVKPDRGVWVRNSMGRSMPAARQSLAPPVQSQGLSQGR